MVIGAITGAFLEHKERRQKERKEDIKQIVTMLNNIVDGDYKKNIESQIEVIYDESQDKFDKLKVGVEMLISTITSANEWIARQIKTKVEVRELIQQHKREIIDILDIEIKLVKPVEDFLNDNK